MALYDSPRPAPFGALSVYRVVRAFEGLVNYYRAWSAARATDAVLRQLSDRELADIGLDRGSIEDISGSLAFRR